MLSVAEIRNVKFTKAMGGYKQEEVDVLLDRIEADYIQFERAFKEYKAKIDSMNQERKNNLQKELDDMVKTAQIKADSMKAAAEDSVARQQLLYDKLKMEMSAFKAALSAKYKEHLEMLKTLPDTAPMDPKRMAEVVAAAVDKAPAPESFIKAEAKAAEPVNAEENTAEKAEKPAGFKVAESDEKAETADNK